MQIFQMWARGKRRGTLVLRSSVHGCIATTDATGERASACGKEKANCEIGTENREFSLVLKIPFIFQMSLLNWLVKRKVDGTIEELRLAGSRFVTLWGFSVT
jgi:hypothetical protein